MKNAAIKAMPNKANAEEYQYRIGDFVFEYWKEYNMQLAKSKTMIAEIVPSRRGVAPVEVRNGGTRPEKATPMTPKINKTDTR